MGAWGNGNESGGIGMGVGNGNESRGIGMGNWNNLCHYLYTVGTV